MDQQREFFRDRDRRHVLMITNHGVHEWQVVPGLPDTGGQNVYVNQFTEALVSLGYRVTILNRGGYPHPVTKAPQSGTRYHPSGHARIVYLEDGRPEFIRKEDMDEQLPALAENLHKVLADESDTFDLIISHYWDAGKLGTMVNKSGNGRIAPHVWVPHSLGAIKKRNMHPSTWADLRIDERIDNEKSILPHLDGGVATSTTIRQSFKEDYDYDAKYFLPPCIDTDRNYPMKPDEYESVWAFLSEVSGLDIKALKSRKIVTEISRTDKTKRKDVLIKAFAEVKKQVPDALLAVTIDPKAEQLHHELLELIKSLGLQKDVIVLGSIWDQLPMLYNITTVYCTPSVMEGFGMSAQEAAASKKPVVASNLVPYVCEYLLGEGHDVGKLSLDDGSLGYIMGEGGVVVMADFVEGFAAAITRLLQDDQIRREMGEKAYKITVPYFTWESRTTDLLDDLGITPHRHNGQIEVSS